MSSELYRKFGIDPTMVLCVHEGFENAALSACATSAAAPVDCSSRSSEMLGCVSEGDFIPRLVPLDATNKRHLPTGINFPTNTYLTEVQQTAHATLRTTAVRAVRSEAQRVEDDVDPAALEQQVTSELLSRRYEALPVLQIMDRYLAIQRAALEEHARYTQRCESNTLFTINDAPRLK